MKQRLVSESEGIERNVTKSERETFLTVVLVFGSFTLSLSIDTCEYSTNMLEVIVEFDGGDQCSERRLL